MNFHNTNLDPIGTLGRVSARWEAVSVVGSCNFCTDQKNDVLKISGQGLSIRMCQECFSRIKDQADTTAPESAR